MSNESTLGVVEFKIDQLTKIQQIMTKQVEDLDDKLLNPEKGLFSRVRSVDTAVEKHSSELSSACSDIDKLVDVCTSHENRISNIDRWVDDHEIRDAELRDAVTGLVSSIKPLSED